MTVLGAAPKPTPEELKTAVWEQWKDYSARGFTTVTDLAYIPNKDFDSLLEDISLDNTCPVRLALYRVGILVPESRKATVCCPQLFPNDGHYTVRF